jgi:hypothetical protein
MAPTVVIDFAVESEIDEAMEALIESPVPLNSEEPSLELAETRIARSYGDQTTVGRQGEYRVADLSSLAPLIQAEQFHVPEYTPVLLQIIEEILRQEAPILDALLVQRVARAHGFQRSGRLIRDRVLELADQHHHVQQAGFEEVFVWHAEGDVMEWSTYRVPVSANDARSIEEIAAEEVRIAASIIDAADPALEVARLLGVKRLTGAARQRIERILNA